MYGYTVGCECCLVIRWLKCSLGFYDCECVTGFILTCFTFAGFFGLFCFRWFSLACFALDCSFHCFALDGFKLEYWLNLICFGRFAHSVSMCFFFGGLFCFCLLMFFYDGILLKGGFDGYYFVAGR